MNQPGDVVAAQLEALGIAFHRDANTFTFALSGEHKKSMPVALTIRERTLALEAFFLRRPLDNASEVYRLLLSRNMRSGPVRFAADAEGDAYIVADVALGDLHGAAMDALLGAALSLADEMFPHAVELGFASYLERDRAYRAAHGE